MGTSLQQDTFDLSKSSFSCMLKWCDAVAVGKIDIGSMIDEQLHNLLMCFATVA